MSVELSRRGLIRGFAVVAAVSVVGGAKGSQAFPVLWQDGVNCDAEAIEALMRGEKVLAGDDLISAVEGEDVIIQNADFWIRRLIRCPNKFSHRVLIRDCTFENLLAPPDTL